MVVGLDKFREHFARFAGRFVVIGGSALQFVLEDLGLPVRGTKDIDIVLTLEALDEEFATALWEFVAAGGYEIDRVSEDGEVKNKTDYYRFSRPGDRQYPAMLELFSRKPDLIEIPADRKFRVIKEDIDLSFSAMLLDDDYYDFLMANRREDNGISWATPLALVALKAYAWVELTKARNEGAPDATADRIKKHKKDVVTLAQIIDRGTVSACPAKIASNVRDLLDNVDEARDLRNAGYQMTLAELRTLLETAFPVPEA